MAARHLEGDIYEVRATGDRSTYRLLFAPQGHSGQVLLALTGLKKKTQKTPVQVIRLAKKRLRDWQIRGNELKPQHGG